MSDVLVQKLRELPRSERDGMLLTSDSRAFRMFMELLIQGRLDSLNGLLDAAKADNLLLVGKLLGERLSYRQMRDRILAFRQDIERINAAEDKKEAEGDGKTGKE